MHLTGVSMLNNAFAETGMNDGATLMPLMFAVIFVLTWIIIRSFARRRSPLWSIIVLSSTIGMGIAGLRRRIKLTPIAMSAPIVILTLAVADSIHILLTLRNLVRNGMAKSARAGGSRTSQLSARHALPRSPPSSAFSSLNFSDSPPYWHLGNITAVGIGGRVAVLGDAAAGADQRDCPTSVRLIGANQDWSQRAMMDRFADFVIRQPQACADRYGRHRGNRHLISFVPVAASSTIEWVEYFDRADRVPRSIRTKAQAHFFGLYPIEFSVPSSGTRRCQRTRVSGKHRKADAAFLREQPNVTHVHALSDIMKRLNRNMHGDAPGLAISDARRP